MSPVHRSFAVPAVTILGVLAGLCGTLAATARAVDQPPVQMAGKGQRREALNALQFKPFDGSLWSKLVGWSDGKAIAAEQIKGKPVLIVSWASWFRASQNGLKFAQEVAAKYESLGLMVVAVHHQRGFEKAKATADEQKITLRYAHDEKGEFFSALKIDGAGPDYYLIDRAGRLRFAGVARESLDDAVAIVSKETPAEAAKAQPPATASGPAKGEGSGAAAGRDEARLPAAAYAGVKWPEKNQSPLAAKDFQGKALPAAFGKERYIGLVPDRNGKIVVLDFWATWCGPCKAAIPHLEKLAKKYDKDAVVIGISDEQESVVKGFLERGKHEYYQAIDPKGTIKDAIGVQGIPHVVVLSTDGVVRWQGNPYPGADLRSLQDTLAELVKIDPGVQARQAKAEVKGKPEDAPGGGYRYPERRP